MDKKMQENLTDTLRTQITTFAIKDIIDREVEGILRNEIKRQTLNHFKKRYLNYVKDYIKNNITVDKIEKVVSGVVAKEISDRIKGDPEMFRDY